MLLGTVCGVLAHNDSAASILTNSSAEVQPANKKQTLVKINNFPDYVYPSYLNYYFQEIIVPELLGGPVNKNDIEVNNVSRALGEEPLLTIKLNGEVDVDKFARKLKILLRKDLKCCNIVIGETIKQPRNKKQRNIEVPTSVLISNLPPNTTPQHLHYFFYGKVAGLSRVDDPEVFQENEKVYGRLIFKSLTKAENCINKLNGHAFEGRKKWKLFLKIEEQSAVFVDILRKGMHINNVARAFSPAGKVISFELFKNEFGIPTESGKVTFINQSSARNCIQMFNGTVCPIGKHNRAIIVCEYEVFQHECAVCYEYFDEIDILCCERISEHSETHSICKGCARQHAKSLITDGHVGQGGAGLPCSTGGCDQVILWAKVKRLVDKKTVNLLEKRLTTVALLNIKGIEFCKSCEYGEIVDVSCSEQKYFQCKNEKCYVGFCRKCKVDRVVHEGYPCSYVDPTNIKERARKKYEEDLSSVAVRICPHCRTQFQKTSGCNKMVCATCNVTMCYICRATNITYDHFQRSCGVHTSSQTIDAKCIEEIHKQAIANGLQEEVEKQKAAEKLTPGCTIS